MNPKIDKAVRNIEKTKRNIAELQSQLKELERMKTELENADIVAMVRGIDMPPSEFEAFARAFMEQRANKAVPDGFSIPANYLPYPVRENDDIDDEEDEDEEYDDDEE